MDSLHFWSGFFITHISALNPAQPHLPHHSIRPTLEAPLNPPLLPYFALQSWHMWFLLPEQVLHYLSLYSFHWFNFTYLLCPCIHRGSRLLHMLLSPPMTTLDITTALYFLTTTSATLHFTSTWIRSYRYDIVELPNSSSILVPGILNLMWQTSKRLIDGNLGRWWAVMDLGEKNESFSH